MFTDLAWRLAREASLDADGGLEIVRRNDDSNRNADFEDFVNSRLHEELGQASRERIGRRAVTGGGGRAARATWWVVPVREEYELYVELRKDGESRVRSTQFSVSALGENMRLGEVVIEEDSPFGGRAILSVKTEPAGAAVLVGGERAGETPLTRSDLRAGTWTVVLEHPLYETVRLEGLDLKDRRVLKVDRRLSRARGAVTVLLEGEAPGGWVEHGGRRHEVPVTLEGLLSGPVELRLGAPGHREVRVEVEVPKGEVAMVERRLERIRYGTLTGLAEPSDAAVGVEGAGPYRPGMRLPEGTYRLRVSAPGWKPWEGTVVHGRAAPRHEVRLARLPPPADEVEESLGMTREERRLVQDGLVSLGYELVADGLFGSGTREAIRGYQGRKGLSETGYLTAAQAGALRALGEEARQSKRREAERRADDEAFVKAKERNTPASYREYLARREVRRVHPVGTVDGDEPHVAVLLVEDVVARLGGLLVAPQARRLSSTGIGMPCGGREGPASPPGGLAPPCGTWAMRFFNAAGPSSRTSTAAFRPWGASRPTSSCCSSGSGSTSCCTRRARRGRLPRCSRSAAS